jgi:lambda family phage portal protein
VDEISNAATPLPEAARQAVTPPRRLMSGSSTFVRSSGIGDFFALPRGGDSDSRLAAWFGRDAGPNSSLWTHKRDTFRVREQVDINPIARRGLSIWTTNTAGDGILPILIAYPRLERRLRRWFRECDARGMFHFVALLKQIAWLVRRDGGCIVRLRRRLDTARTPLSKIKGQIQVLEIDHLRADHNVDLGDGRVIVGGIEKSATDEILAYHLLRYHPLDAAATSGRMRIPDPIRVPASEVLYITEVGRPGEVRPSPPLRVALAQMRDVDTYLESEVVRKKTAALNAGFLRLAGGPDDKEIADALLGRDGTGKIEIPWEPGMITELPPGYSLETTTPTDVGDSFDVFLKRVYAAIAVATDVPYALLVEDYASLQNDRLYRGAMLEFTRYTGFWQKAVLEHQAVRPIINWVIALCVLDGLERFDNDEFADVIDYECAYPARGYIHPVQEVAAHKSAVELGIESPQSVAQENGADYTMTAIERAEAIEMDRQLGLAPGPEPTTRFGKMIADRVARRLEMTMAMSER